MAHLFRLSDEAWAAIDRHLPRGRPGKPRVDDRRVISGILHVLKTGCRWRDVPPEYGPATTIYTVTEASRTIDTCAPDEDQWPNHDVWRCRRAICLTANSIQVAEPRRSQQTRR